jgi:hypothetical protein
MFYLLSGELTGFCEGDSWTATPGSFVFVPRDRRHGFSVTSSGPATALVITGPSQLDRQIAVAGQPAPDHHQPPLPGGIPVSPVRSCEYRRPGRRGLHD